jgi:hypothetical protein
VWTAGEVLTASNMNTYIRLNLDFLYNAGGYRARGYATAVQAIPNATVTAVSLNAVSYDSNANFNTGTGLYTAPAAGYYQAVGSIKYGYGGVGGTHLLAIIVNGAYRAVSGDRYSPASTSPGTLMADVLSLAANDTVGLYTAQFTGGAINTNVADGTGVNVFLAVHRLSQ